MNRPHRRLPFGPLEQFVADRVGIDPLLAFVCGGSLSRRVTDCTIALEAGTSRRQVFRWRRYGIRLREADRVAVALGVNSRSIWPDIDAMYEQASA